MNLIEFNAHSSVEKSKQKSLNLYQFVSVERRNAYVATVFGKVNVVQHLAVGGLVTSLSLTVIRSSCNGCQSW